MWLPGGLSVIHPGVAGVPVIPGYYWFVWLAGHIRGAGGSYINKIVGYMLRPVSVLVPLGVGG